MQLCLGATYSWSVFVEPIKGITGLMQGTVQLPFSVFYFAFPAVMVVSGTLLPKFGPRKCAVFGGIVFGAGWLTATLGKIHFSYTVLGVGLMGGFGVGFAYIVPIATLIKWFPKQKGLVTGVAVAGFGGGAALVSKFSGYLLTVSGMAPFDVFGIFGCIFFVLVVIAGSSMVNPPDINMKKNSSMKLKDFMGKGLFWILYFAMFSGLSAGFTVNANLKELYKGVTAEAGITAVALFAVANALGRISWGLFFDRVKSATAVRTNLLFQAAVLFASTLILTSDKGLYLFAILTGFNYGGILVVYASTIARKWGSDRVGQVYGWLFSANIPAAVSPIIAGYYFDMNGNFTLPLMIIAGLMTVAATWGASRVAVGEEVMA